MSVAPRDLLLEHRLGRIAEVVSGRTRTLTVVLEDLEDPHNIGAILRSCDCLGIQEVHVFTRDHDFRPNPKITQGCEKWLDLHQHRDLERCLRGLQERGFLLCATTLADPTGTLLDLPLDRPLALVFGTEKTGLSAQALALCPIRFRIPMLGFSQSLNVSVAAAITLAHLVFGRMSRDGHAGDLPQTERAALSERFERLSVNQRERIFSSADLSPPTIESIQENP